MNNLHEVINQIVNNPQVLAIFIDNPQALIETFNLSTNELTALKGVLNQTTLQNLLSPNNIKQVSQSILEQVWVPI